MSREAFEALIPVPDDVQRVDDGYVAASLTDDAASSAEHYDSLLTGWCLRQGEVDERDARIAELEAQVRTAGAEALVRVAAKLRQAGADLPVRVEGTIESAHKGGLSCALVVIEEEARRLRGEGE